MQGPESVVVAHRDGKLWRRTVGRNDDPVEVELYAQPVWVVSDTTTPPHELQFLMCCFAQVWTGHPT